METVKELRQRLRRAIGPGLCRFASQEDRIKSLQEVKAIIKELNNVKELKDVPNL